MYTLTKADTHAVACVNMQGSKSNACVSEDGSAYSLNAMHGHDVHAVAAVFIQDDTTPKFHEERAGCLRRDAGGEGACVMTHAMTVRRLTPRECERLQGFPDDYTAIPWRGKTETPDGPRYKALGNSMAVNCMEWIGERIAAQEVAQ